MMTINRMMTNICSGNLTKSKNFYTKLFDLEVNYESDWFIHLIAKNQQLELGIIDRTNEIIPDGFQKNPQGFYITFIVDDVDKIFKIVESEGLEIISKPTDTFYGQRRLLMKDPDGALIDISSPIKIS